ncbi:hypothetical protein DL771_009035 [Monosporascus sp. 5C6A]|nr:hypothetical protein DL771_009035 [Monosporascus sp. 5C6A]
MGSTNNNSQQRSYPLRRPRDSQPRQPQDCGSGGAPTSARGPYPGYDCMGSCTCLCGCGRAVEGWRRACDAWFRGEHRSDDAAKDGDDAFADGPSTEWSYGPADDDDGW